MINDIQEYFRYRIYDNSRILVNDLKDVVDEIHIFLEKKLYPYIKENDCRIIIDNIEILIENEKCIWRLLDKGEINNIETKEFDIYSIKEFVDSNYIKEIKDKHVDYPKDLCGVSLISFIEAILHFVFKEDEIPTTDVFGICMLSNNSKNNVVYEMQ